MNKFIYAFLISALFFPTATNAKYNPPKDVPQVYRAQRIAVGEINRLDADQDGKLTPEEFKAKVEKYSRTEEKKARRARKKGIYQSPEEQFLAADKDGDGYLDFNELSSYVADYQKKDNGKAQYY